MGGYDKSTREGSDQNYWVNIRTGTTGRRTSIPVGRFGFAACSYGKFIFVLGGMKESVQVDNGQSVPDSLNKCHAYDIIKDKWNDMPDLPEGRIGSTAIVINQTLFCIGGQGKRQSIFALSLQTPAT
jgi:N-acetylneuraminic acid mutarotase